MVTARSNSMIAADLIASSAIYSFMTLSSLRFFTKFRKTAESEGFCTEQHENLSTENVFYRARLANSLTLVNIRSPNSIIVVLRRGNALKILNRALQFSRARKKKKRNGPREK